MVTASSSKFKTPSTPLDLKINAQFGTVFVLTPGALCHQLWVQGDFL